VDVQLDSELRSVAARGLKRALEPLEDARGRVDFTSNDYLGLARHPAVVEGALGAVRDHGAGARASRLLGGGSPLDGRVEAATAEWLGAEAALLFPTGYQANIGLVTALAGPGDTLFSDERNHASLIDACRLSRATVRVFGHDDLEHLERELVGARGARRRLVLTEGAFSMDGDVPQLAEMAELCLVHDAWLIVDEAHAAGVVGPAGAGAWAAAETEGAPPQRLLARMVTGGKALGAAGGIVVGSQKLRETLVHGARSFIFTTGASPATAGALEVAIELARAADEERRRLHELNLQLATALGAEATEAAILPYIVGSNGAAMELAEQLQQRGFEVRAVRPPTVPPGSARLRLVLHAFNQPEEVADLARELAPLTHPTSPVELSEQKARPIFVVGTDTEIGKTVVSAALCQSLARMSPVSYWKPVQTGVESDTEAVRGLCEGCEVSFLEPRHEFPLPASPHEAAAEAGGAVDFEGLSSQLDEELALLPDGGELVVELAGGLLVPYDDEHTQADWLAVRRPRIVLVARSGLGTLNHTLLTLEALRSRQLEVETLVLVGEPHDSNRETLARMSEIPVVLELPPTDLADPTALGRWLDGCGGFFP
jgi:8-amino-7-oxononanoate synthase